MISFHRASQLFHTIMTDSKLTCGKHLNFRLFRQSVVFGCVLFTVTEALPNWGLLLQKQTVLCATP